MLAITLKPFAPASFAFSCHSGFRASWTMTANIKKISLAFGSTGIEFEIPERNLASVILPSEFEIKEEEASLIKKSLENPVTSKRLSEIVNPDSKVAIIVSDVTRPTPTAKLLPPLLEELYLGGAKNENITIVFALGLHRLQTEEESRKLVGEQVYEKIRCIQHAPECTQQTSKICKPNLRVIYS